MRLSENLDTQAEHVQVAGKAVANVEWQWRDNDDRSSDKISGSDPCRDFPR
jgi:hypothetical protein